MKQNTKKISKLRKIWANYANFKQKIFASYTQSPSGEPLALFVTFRFKQRVWNTVAEIDTLRSSRAVNHFKGCSRAIEYYVYIYIRKLSRHFSSASIHPSPGDSAHYPVVFYIDTDADAGWFGVFRQRCQVERKSPHFIRRRRLLLHFMLV
jgi:hypothetical protein